MLTGELCLVITEQAVVMNPISGTYRYPVDGPSVAGLDEELKMMARVCPAGGRVSGPRLKEMARPGFASMQFHAEPVLTHNGPAIFAARVDEIMPQGE